MTSETVKNDFGLVIGFVEEDSLKIQYRSLVFGIISYYDKQSKIYYRFRQIPGKPITTFYGDMGLSDLRYWDGK